MNWKGLEVSANFPAEIVCEEAGTGETCITLTWTKGEYKAPALNVTWAVPLVDIQYEWYPLCGRDRALRTDWDAPIYTSFSTGAPVFCFYNEEGQNRLTIALSEVRLEALHSYGVHEEDGTLLCCLKLPLPMTGSAERYSVTLLRLRENMRYEAALRQVAAWWERVSDTHPMPVPTAARLPMYSTWYSFHQETVAADLEAACVLAAQDGFRTVIVDDGWQTSDCTRDYGYCGDWQPAPEKIPDMRAHVARVHALGMKYMLWYSVVYVGEHSRHWETFKTMLLRHDTWAHAGILDPRFPQVRAFLVDTYVKALKAWDLDGFKLDFIDSFGVSSDAPPVREGMDYALVEEAVCRLLTEVREALTAIKPDILIEFRQNYIGPAIRGFGNMFRVADCPADWLSNRVGMVDLRLLSGDTAVHSDMLMWHSEDSVENAARQLLNVFFTVPQISVRPDRVPEAHRAMLRHYLALMEQLQGVLTAPLRAEAPHLLYPLVRARKDDTEVIVCYDADRVVRLSDAARTYVFNATGAEKLLLHGTDVVYRVYDCLGREGKRGETAQAYAEVAIPSGGYAVLEAEGR